MAGITLVELLVVLGIIGLIVGMGVPAMTGYARQTRLKAATRQVVGLVSLARSLAISSHADHAVRVDEEGGAIVVVNLSSGELLERKVRLPSSVTVSIERGGEPSSETEFVFRPTGSLSGRTTSLILADNERHHTITVTGPTGAVIVQ